MPYLVFLLCTVLSFPTARLGCPAVCYISALSGSDASCLRASERGS